MNIMDAIAERHSVRSYTDQRIPHDVWDALDRKIDAVNRESGLSFTLVCDDSSAFDGFLASYGHFENVRNFIVCAGPKAPNLEERIGYYGEGLVLECQLLGLNTCWVGGTYSRSAVKRLVRPEERLVCIIAVGYGATPGASHPVKSVDELGHVVGEAPSWFEQGMWAAQLAPTAINQQRFLITYDGGTVSAKSLGGFFSDVDLGIVKRHFEIGAGKDNVAWV